MPKAQTSTLGLDDWVSASGAALPVESPEWFRFDPKQSFAATGERQEREYCERRKPAKASELSGMSEAELE